jgi:ATP-binding cassette subfamily F protein 3
LDAYKGTILLVTHDRYLVDALATQIWEIDPQESHLEVFKGTYSQMKEEREKQAARAAAQQAAASAKSAALAQEAEARARRSRNAKTRDERRKVAQMQELENRIASLEAQLADLSAALENPPADAGEVTRLGREYARVQEQMDEELAQWERLTH